MGPTADERLDKLIAEHRRKEAGKATRNTLALADKKPPPTKAIEDIKKEKPKKKREATVTSVDAPKSKRILAITDYAKMTPAEQALHEKLPLVVVNPRKGTGKKKKGNGAHDPAVQFHDSKDDPYIARPKLPQKISD